MISGHVREFAWGRLADLYEEAVFSVKANAVAAVGFTALAVATSMGFVLVSLLMLGLAVADVRTALRIDAAFVQHGRKRPWLA